ncbi:hypothetical protein L9F63_011276, partial [Diploptera punctata]
NPLMLVIRFQLSSTPNNTGTHLECFLGGLSIIFMSIRFFLYHVRVIDYIQDHTASSTH